MIQHPLFVYGTLMSDQRAFYRLAPAVTRSVRALLPDAQLFAVSWYPVAVSGAGEVHGEVHWLAPGAYAAVQGLRALAENADPEAPYIPAAAAGAFAIVFTAIVGDLLREALLGYDEELDARARVIEEIESVDPRTGATKSQHADRLLNTEVERARRYGRPFTVLMIAPDDWDEYMQRVGRQQAERIIAELAQHYLARLRTVDTLIQMNGARFAALLPETGVEGAQVAAEKLAAAGEDLLGVEVRTGIASFPDDEVTASGLMREAEEALSFAQAASIRVASRSLLT